MLKGTLAQIVLPGAKCQTCHQQTQMLLWRHAYVRVLHVHVSVCVRACVCVCAYTEHLAQLVFWDIMDDLSSQKTCLQFLPCIQPDWPWVSVPL